MFYVLQKEYGKDFDIDVLALKKEIEYTRRCNEYITFTKEEISTADFRCSNVAIPVGTIEFIEGYLKNICKIEKMNPIEIPKVLRREEFLCRDYKIVDKDYVEKLDGKYFIKYASHLKDFSFVGDTNTLKELNKKKNEILKEGLYVVSEIKEIISEYRVFVVDDDIKGIQFYNGDVLTMPLPNEIKKIKKMTGMYVLDKDRPRAYTMDIAIIKNDKNQRDIMIIEVHPFACVGLYGFNGNILLNAYRYGIDYYKEINKELEKD